MSRKEELKKRRQALIEEKGIIFLENVSKSYSKGAPALNGVSLNIKKGEFVGIIGRNGSGKSTLLKILAGIYYPQAGEITINGTLIKIMLNIPRNSSINAI